MYSEKCFLYTFHTCDPQFEDNEQYAAWHSAKVAREFYVEDAAKQKKATKWFHIIMTTIEETIF